MNKQKLQAVVFFIMGIGLFVWVYRGIDLSKILPALGNLNYFWIFVTLVLGLVSHWIRALRWKMLILPLGYNIKTLNLFLSVLVLYFTNLIIPRGGEIARCGVITKYENIPVSKLLGTVVVERISEFAAFLLILFAVFLWQFDFFLEFFEKYNLGFSIENVQQKLIFLIVGVAAVVALVFAFLKMKAFGQVREKLLKIKDDFLSGIKAVLKLSNKGLYIIYTFAIYLLWTLMFYATFLAFGPTADFSFKASILVYFISFFAFLLPIQAGMGAWHYIVVQCLLLYNIDAESGLLFALISHTFTSLIYLVLGVIALAVFPLVNSKQKSPAVAYANVKDHKG